MKRVTTEERKTAEKQGAPFKEHATNFSIARVMGHLKTS